jgi:hypothetical protein
MYGGRSGQTIAGRRWNLTGDWIVTLCIITLRVTLSVTSPSLHSAILRRRTAHGAREDRIVLHAVGVDCEEGDRGSHQ